MISIKRDALEAMTAHARQTHPRECCGLLIGTREKIARAWPAANVAREDTRFLIDPRDHFAALRAARADHLDVVGAYHSHPFRPAAPSATDLAEATDPSFLTIIIAAGTAADEVRAFYLEAGNFREVALVTVG